LNIAKITVVSILLLVLTANPTLIAIGQEETPTEEPSEEVTEETSEEESMSEEETSEEMTEEVVEEEMTEETMTEETMEEETMTDEEMADDTMMMEEEMMTTTQIKSPKKQMNEGVEAGAVVCNEGLELIIKTSTGSAACVKASSVETLIARGWGSTPA
jgi:outer membrane biosynthesis protein TonB